MHTVLGIVEANPGSNQSEIVRWAQTAGVSKHQVERCLRDTAFH